jgi:hypothetical protein
VITYSPEPLVVRGDVDVTGYEIRLQTAEVYRVSGVVLDETGNPKPKVLVQLLPRIQLGTRAIGGGEFSTFVGPGPSVGPAEARVISAADGSFEFPAVRPGSGSSPRVLRDRYRLIRPPSSTRFTTALRA